MIGELRIENDGGPPQRVEIQGGPLILGGAPNADIHVVDRRLSREHCTIEVVGRQLVVTDLGSTNGTYARGQRITRLAIEAGETFIAGGTRITFGVTGSAANEPATDDRRVSLGMAPTRTRTASARPVHRMADALTAKLPTAPSPARRVADVRGVSRPAPGPSASGAPARLPVNPSMIEGYRIVRRLGEGTMGTAYLAHSLETGEECVLKLISYRGRSETAIFFIREAQMGSKLRHPNIVPVVDFGESGGLLFLAMEYVSGGSLLDGIERDGPLGNAEALGQLVQLTDALDHASHKKFVHRDIKPANILLTADGVPKLADFGLAKMLSETQHAQLTGTGEARGTPMYMPPEALTGAAEADTRGDIYSLGATYYHALTGRPPFPPESLTEVLRMVAECEPEPLETMNPNVHPELAGVIRRMMHKRIEDRYPTTSELDRDLERIVGVMRESPRPIAP